MQKRYKFYLVGIMEPFQDKQNLKVYRKKLGFNHGIDNVSGKIWAFIDKIMKTKILSDEEQQLTLKVYNQVYGGFGYSSICQVYSK